MTKESKEALVFLVKFLSCLTALLCHSDTTLLFFEAFFISKFLYLPTHSSKVHFIFCKGGPMQFLPLLDGGGLVQVLVLVLKQLPLPCLLHSPQIPQTVHPPATRKKGTVSTDPLEAKRVFLYSRLETKTRLLIHYPRPICTVRSSSLTLKFVPLAEKKTKGAHRSLQTSSV